MGRPIAQILVVGEIAPPIRDCLAEAGCEVIPVGDLGEAFRRSRAGDAPSAIISDPSQLLPDDATRQKLDTLYQAGTELSGLDADQLSDLDVGSRIELLKQNLQKTIHDLLHYDVSEIRLLDRATGELEPLLSEGLTEEAEHRILHARAEGNGVTGFVAATGQSYLCPDTEKDPRYIVGASGARSSLTVPLIVQGEVIGTFNVESPKPNAFTADDMRFTELFANQLAQALHTLQLLSAQQDCTAAQSVDSINRGIALPMDEILVHAAEMLGRSPDPEAAEMLRAILDETRAVRASIRQVAGTVATLPAHRTAKGYNTADLRGRKILVVDADERTRKAAHSLLDRYGCLVETAGTALRGIALARTAEFDAILADIRPPDLGGYETYRRLKEARPESRIALMTVFGYDSAHSIVKARQDGMRFVLFKPFRLDQVLDALLAPAPEDHSQVTRAC